MEKFLQSNAVRQCSARNVDWKWDPLPVDRALVLHDSFYQILGSRKRVPRK